MIAATGECRHRHLETLNGREHRYGRCDHSVTVEKRRPEQPDENEQHRLAGATGLPHHQRRKRQDASLTIAVGTQHKGQVLDRDDEDQRPEDE